MMDSNPDVLSPVPTHPLNHPKTSLILLASTLLLLLKDHHNQAALANTGIPRIPVIAPTNNRPCLSLRLTTSLYRSFPKLTLEYFVRQPIPGAHTDNFSSSHFRALYSGEITEARISV